MEIYVKQGRSILYWLLPAFFFIFSESVIAKSFVYPPWSMGPGYKMPELNIMPGRVSYAYYLAPELIAYSESIRNERWRNSDVPGCFYFQNSNLYYDLNGGFYRYKYSVYHNSNQYITYIYCLTLGDLNELKAYLPLPIYPSTLESNVYGVSKFWNYPLYFEIYVFFYSPSLKKTLRLNYIFPPACDLDVCKYDLSAKKSAIQQEGSALFSGLTNAQAALPCYPLLCLSGMESQLQPISNAFLLIGSLGAGFIVFRKKPKKGRDRHV